VIPFGDLNFFTNSRYDDLDPVIHGGLAVQFPITADLVAGAQLEGNTSPFGGVSVLDQSVFGLYGSLRYRLMEQTFLAGTIGTGFGDLGSDITLAASMDVFW